MNEKYTHKLNVMLQKIYSIVYENGTDLCAPAELAEVFVDEDPDESIDFEAAKNYTK